MVPAQILLCPIASAQILENSEEAEEAEEEEGKKIAWPRILTLVPYYITRTPGYLPDCPTGYLPDCTHSCALYCAYAKLRYTARRELHLRNTYCTCAIPPPLAPYPNLRHTYRTCAILTTPLPYLCLTMWPVPS